MNRCVAPVSQPSCILYEMPKLSEIHRFSDLCDSESRLPALERCCSVFGVSFSAFFLECPILPQLQHFSVIYGFMWLNSLTVPTRSRVTGRWLTYLQNHLKTGLFALQNLPCLQLCSQDRPLRVPFIHIYSQYTLLVAFVSPCDYALPLERFPYATTFAT